MEQDGCSSAHASIIQTSWRSLFSDIWYVENLTNLTAVHVMNIIYDHTVVCSLFCAVL